MSDEDEPDQRPGASHAIDARDTATVPHGEVPGHRMQHAHPPVKRRWRSPARRLGRPSAKGHRQRREPWASADTASSRQDAAEQARRVRLVEPCRVAALAGHVALGR